MYNFGNVYTIDASAREWFDLGTMTIGEVLAIRTKTGSTYYITRLRGSRRTTQDVFGVMIMTDTNAIGVARATLPPAECRVDRYITVGESLTFNIQPEYAYRYGSQATSPVTSWKLVR
ncbi:MAG: hypothetical protein WAQ25_01695 [Candidatus Saccharimonas sp.]